MDIICKGTNGMNDFFWIPSFLEFKSLPLHRMARDEIIDIYRIDLRKLLRCKFFHSVNSVCGITGDSPQNTYYLSRDISMITGPEQFLMTQGSYFETFCTLTVMLSVMNYVET